MSMQRLLDLARCPTRDTSGAPCMGKLAQGTQSLVCQRCGSEYGFSQPEYGFSRPYDIPTFAPRPDEERAKDKYEDPGQRLAEGYVGQWAFGYLFLKQGASEGFYRTINELGFSAPLPQDSIRHVLEIGCGVGRTTCDYARHYPEAFVVGLDYSPRLLEYAYQMVIGDGSEKEVSIALDQEGYKTVTAPSFCVPNACFVQGSALNLPFASEQFDLVVSPNLIDRVSEPIQMLREAARVLRPGGYFIIADPFNWKNQPTWWDEIRTVAELATYVTDCGLTIDLAFDGLIYREVLDARGAYTEWPVAVIRAVKPLKQ